MAVLLTVPQATVALLPSSADQSQREVVAQGELALSTVPSLRGSEQTLLLTVGPFRYRLLPHLTLSHSTALNTYTLPPLHTSTPPLLLALPFPDSPDAAVDQTTLHTLLADYLAVLEHSPDDLRGKLLLIDEDTGEVLGEMDAGELGVEDDTAPTGLGGAANGGAGKDAAGQQQGPVVIKLDEVQEGRTVGGIKVTEVPEHELDDWMLRGASNLSKNLLTGAGWMSTKLQTASDNYVARATPRSKPVEVSDAARARLEKVNGATLAGKEGVKKVTGFLNRNVQRATEYTLDKGQHGATALFGGQRPDKPPKPPSTKRPLVSRLLLAGHVLLTSVEAGTVQVVDASTESATKSISHKYGEEAGNAAALAAGSVRNVGVAFVDARGIGRKALIIGAGKSIVKARAKKEADATHGGPDATGPDIEDQVAGAQEKEGELILALNSGKEGGALPSNGLPMPMPPPPPPSFPAATAAKAGKTPPPRPPSSTKPPGKTPPPVPLASSKPAAAPSPGTFTPPMLRATSPLASFSSKPGPSPPASPALSPLPPPPRRTSSSLSSASLPASAPSRTNTPPLSPATGVNGRTGWRKDGGSGGGGGGPLSPSGTAAPSLKPPGSAGMTPSSSAGAASTGWRRTPPAPTLPTGPPQCRQPPPAPLQAPLIPIPAPASASAGRTRPGWIRPSAPSEADFEGVLADGLAKVDEGPSRARGTPPAVPSPRGKPSLL